MRLFLCVVIIMSSIKFSYASFPVADTLNFKQDTSQIEEIKKYHSNLVKMGFDLNDCKCEACRKSNKFFKKNTVQNLSLPLYILSSIILLGVVIWFSIFLIRGYNCLDNGSNCPEPTGEKPKRGFPIEFAWISLLLLISLGLALKARFIQLKNKERVLK